MSDLHDDLAAIARSAPPEAYAALLQFAWLITEATYRNVDTDEGDVYHQKLGSDTSAIVMEVFGV